MGEMTAIMELDPSTFQRGDKVPRPYICGDPGIPVRGYTYGMKQYVTDCVVT